MNCIESTVKNAVPVPCPCCTVLVQHATAREVARGSFVVGVQSPRGCIATRDKGDQQQDLSKLAARGGEPSLKISGIILPFKKKITGNSLMLVSFSSSFVTVLCITQVCIIFQFSAKLYKAFMVF